MKKHLICLLVLSLLLALCSAVTAETPSVLLNFEDGVNPGFSKSGACKYEIADNDSENGNHALKVYDRTDASGVEIRSGKLGYKKGDKVRLALRVRQDSGKAGIFCVAFSGSELPELIRSDFPSGVWTELSCEFTCSSTANLRFTTDSSLADADFLLDDVKVEILETSDPLEGKSYGDWPVFGSIPSLKEHYQDHFLFGSELAGSEIREPGRLIFYKSQFAILTPGNELKPDSVFDLQSSRDLVAETGDETAVAVHLTAAKAFLDYCQKYGIAVHGHTLLWHNQTPGTFFRLGYNSAGELADRDIMLGRMENYIKEVMKITEEQYPGLIVSWDVVNEAIDDGTGRPRTNVLWYKTVGPDYIARAFEFARKYARPDVILCYNDYSTPYSPKLSGIVDLLSELVSEGNIDCYGFQAHYESGQPSVGMVENAIKKISALGLKLRVSEMDIKITTRSASAYQIQAARYKELMDLFVKYDKDFIAVQIWGATDDTSWLASNYPLPFGRNGQPKPAFWAMVGGEPAE